MGNKKNTKKGCVEKGEQKRAQACTYCGISTHNQRNCILYKSEQLGMGLEELIKNAKSKSTKGYVSYNNDGSDFKKVKDLILEGFQEVNSQVWSNLVGKTYRTEDEFLAKDIITLSHTNSQLRMRKIVLSKRHWQTNIFK
jgi:hypothetical protein